MSAETEGSEYVVQVFEEFQHGDSAGYAVWRDVARVKVPPRSKRRTVLEAVRKDLAYWAQEHAREGMPERLRVRVLPADVAADITVGVKMGEPELVIGDPGDGS